MGDVRPIADSDDRRLGLERKRDAGDDEPRIRPRSLSDRTTTSPRPERCAIVYFAVLVGASRRQDGERPGKASPAPSQILPRNRRPLLRNLRGRWVGPARAGPRCPLTTDRDPCVERGTIMPAEWGGTAAAAALRRSGPAVIVDGATGDRCFLDDATVTLVPALRPGGTVIPCNLRGPAGLPDCARGRRAVRSRRPSPPSPGGSDGMSSGGAPHPGCPASRQAKYWPPLMVSVEPVMKPACSPARNSTARAISSASPRRPTGMCGRILAFSTSSGIAFTISVPM
ncbi:hypothetical protein SAMN04487843_1122 [Methylobacterium sp. ap11]|nr:hypothetical protein SAMN04487843_1122 [Methylobacterium sp. ap11]